MKTYTKDELLRKYKGRFIYTLKHYDYLTGKSKWEVISVKRKIWENHNTPEEEITF